MPSPISTTLLALGAILTTSSDTAGIIVAGLGAVFEAYIFVRAGLD